MGVPGRTWLSAWTKLSVPGAEFGRGVFGGLEPVLEASLPSPLFAQASPGRVRLFSEVGSSPICAPNRDGVQATQSIHPHRQPCWDCM
jgi:hypothetical protein